MTTRAFDPNAPLERGMTLLEASAGTGKTYSITTIFVRLVVEYGVPVDQILCVTFTKAATSDLVARIRQRLADTDAAFADALGGRSRTSDGTSDGAEITALVARAVAAQQLEKWTKSARDGLEGFDRASIFTMHGFCQRMLQRNALESGIAFDADIVEVDALAERVRDLVDDFWVRLGFDESLGALELLRLVGLTRNALMPLARRAIEHREATIEPSAPDHPAPPDPSALLAARDEARSAFQRVRPLALLADARRHASGIVSPDWRWDNALKVADALADGDLTPKTYQDLEPLDPVWWASQGIFPPTGSAPNSADASTLGAAYRAISAVRAALGAVLPAARRWALGVRHRLATWARTEIRRRNEAQNQLAVNDLLDRLAEALEQGADRARLESAIRRQYAAVIIDEFQDTDPVQWRIFHHLFDRPDCWFYLVGDPKQAIYGFRRADIRTYLAAQGLVDQARHSTLDVNYRSDKALVDAVGHIFGHRQPERAFAIDRIDFYPVAAKRQESPVVAPAGGAFTPCRIVCLDVPNPRASPGDFGKGIPPRVAADIAHTLAQGLTVAGKKVGPTDLAVLVRTNTQAAEVQAALRAHGVPAIIHGQSSVFETTEATELLRVLHALLDPARATLVRAALVTGLLGLRAFELAALDETPRGLERWVEHLRAWQETWMRHSFAQMFRGFVSGRLAALLDHPDGERRTANLLQLGELLHDAATKGELPPMGLLRWLERRIAEPSERDERTSLRRESDAAAVQIVTVHKAKGLQYQFVWCPYFWEPSEIRGDQKDYLLYRDPARPASVTLDIDKDGMTPVRRLRQQSALHDARTEALRLFYVAVTRARHGLTLYWAPLHKAAASPLAYLLFANERAHDPASLDAAVAALAGRLRRWDAARSFAQALQSWPRALFAIETSAPAPASAWSPPSANVTLAPRVWQRTRPLDVHWRRTSFSGLVAGAPADTQAAADEDRAASDEATESASPDDAATVRLATMPSGRQIGNALHKILELADFASATPASLAPLARAELAHHGLPEAHADDIAAALTAVLATPLDASGLRLKDLPRAERLPELSFVFPLAHRATTSFPSDPEPVLDPRALHDVFACHPTAATEHWLTRLARLPFFPARGFLSGSIDLAFRAPHDGRFYLLDWKSNHLGKTAADYRYERVRDAMDHHHYHLQYHLYAVALARHLARRIPGWDYARDFGGVFYLFLRGIDPSHALGTGIFAARPEPALIADLDRLLARGALGTGARP